MGSNLVARPYGLPALRTAIQSCSPSLRARRPRPLLQPPIRQLSDDYGFGRNISSDNKSSPEVIHGELTDLLDEFGLADIPSDTAEGHGVRISVNGELRIVDRLESRKRHATALCLWPSMTSLSTRDFLSLADRGEHLRGWRSLGADKGRKETLVVQLEITSSRADNRRKSFPSVPNKTCGTSQDGFFCSEVPRTHTISKRGHINSASSPGR
jgi:hypothetical protein